MNTRRIIVTFDYWTEADYALAKEFAHVRSSSGVSLRDDYPSFWVTIDTGLASQNIKMAEDLMTIMSNQ